MEQVTRNNLLYDYYSTLLTPRQRQFFELHFQYDLSLGEIGENAGVSRQAVHDLLRRTLNQLEHYEQHLGLAARDQQRSVLLEQLEQGIAKDEEKSSLLPLVHKLKEV